MNARLHEENLSCVLNAACKGCKDIHHVLDNAVREHVGEVTLISGLE